MSSVRSLSKKNSLMIVDIIAYSAMAFFFGCLITQAIICNQIGWIAIKTNNDSVFNYAISNISNSPKYGIMFMVPFIPLYAVTRFSIEKFIDRRNNRIGISS